ncbi:membrane protein [Marinobacterium zhoushanense]|uniref:Membrane protein n=1 Tax=Marinobacterium zhoushanense TaxID=1679163 RepID=A0ABQ1KM97_9GAMM|nr:MAPEG family protein [Marinobacterium zhoushanense]GGC00600.1 membrane protein [Marinobacterium zhoushanense]
MPDIFLVLFFVSILPILLAVAGGYFRVSELGKFDNHRPREQQAVLTGAGARVVAAQKNAWEALIFFAAVTLIAVASPVDLDKLSAPAYLFLASRVVHPIMYAADLAALRSIVFAVGWFACIYIFLIAYSAYGS